jgi:hypothetical protein
MWLVRRNCRRMLLAAVKFMKNVSRTIVILLAWSDSGWAITVTGGCL